MITTFESSAIAEIIQENWNVQESIARCRLLLRRGTAANILLGLELLRAKIHLKHGNWYPYLLKVGIDPSGVSRRMKLTLKYLTRCGIKEPGERVTIGDIQEGELRLESNPAEMHGLEKEDLWSDNSKRNDTAAPDSIFGFSLARYWPKIDALIHKRLNPQKRREAIETLEMWADQLRSRAQQLRERTEKLHHSRRTVKKAITDASVPSIQEHISS